MAFTAAHNASDTMSDMNVTPLVDVMLVLLIIFMVTAPLMDMRIDMRLPGESHRTPPPSVERQLTVEPGDLFKLDGQALAPAALEQALAQWRQEQPAAVLKVAVSPDADYQSAATALAVAKRAGVENVGLVEP